MESSESNTDIKPEAPDHVESVSDMEQSAWDSPMVSHFLKTSNINPADI